MEVDKVYRVLHKVTEKGFDTVGISYGPFRVILKTLTPHELEMVKYHSFGGGLELFRLYRLSYATFVFNGEIVLEDRFRNIEKLVEAYRSAPLDVFEELEELSIKLQDRYKRYCLFIAGYCYSAESRILWDTRKGQPLLSTEVTGIPGTSLLGVPESVEVWNLLNLSLREEKKRQENLSNAIFIASATNPEGVKKISSRIYKEYELASKKREMLIKYGNEANKRIMESQESRKSKRWTQKLDTTQSIIDELERQMHGVKDKHDLFMEGYSKKLKLDLAKKEEAENIRLEQLRAKRKNDPEGGSYEVTPEEMASIQDGSVDYMDIIREKKNKSENSRSSTKTVGKRVIGSRRGVVGNG